MCESQFGRPLSGDETDLLYGADGSAVTRRAEEKLSLVDFVAELLTLNGSRRCRRQVLRHSGQSPEDLVKVSYRRAQTFSRKSRAAAVSLLSSFVHLSASNLQQVRVPVTVRQTAGRSWRWGDPTARGLHLKWRR